MKTIDINADLGEGCPHDDLLIPLLSSANIACGGHAGDETTIHRAIHSCMTANVAVGAHPGYEDRINFGRVHLDLSYAQIRESIHRQIARFLRIAMECGAIPHHVKPHGALYNQANKDPELSAALIEPIADLIPGTMFYCPPSGELAVAARSAGLNHVAEGFADRRYQADGSLVPRTEPCAIILDVNAAAEQAFRMYRHEEVDTAAGIIIPLHARSLCIHGDGSNAFAMLQAVRARLESSGVVIQAP